MDPRFFPMRVLNPSGEVRGSDLSCGDPKPSHVESDDPLGWIILFSFFLWQMILQRNSFLVNSWCLLLCLKADFTKWSILKLKTIVLPPWWRSSPGPQGSWRPLAARGSPRSWRTERAKRVGRFLVAVFFFFFSEMVQYYRTPNPKKVYSQLTWAWLGRSRSANPTASGRRNNTRKSCFIVKEDKHETKIFLYRQF